MTIQNVVDFCVIYVVLNQNENITTTYKFNTYKLGSKYSTAEINNYYINY